MEEVEILIKVDPMNSRTRKQVKGTKIYLKKNNLVILKILIPGHQILEVGSAVPVSEANHRALTTEPCYLSCSLGVQLHWLPTI